MSIKQSESGFTLAELMIVVAILATVFTGMIQMFIQTSALANLSGNKTIALSEAQSKIEEIRSHAYDQIVTDYSSGGTPGNIFDLSLLNGKGIIYIDNSNAELLVLEVVICWLDKYGRVIGEDTDLDGILDLDEDTNDDFKISSEIKLMSMITRR